MQDTQFGEDKVAPIKHIASGVIFRKLAEIVQLDRICCMDFALNVGKEVFGSLIGEGAHLGLDHATSSILKVEPPYIEWSGGGASKEVASARIALIAAKTRELTVAILYSAPAQRLCQ